jgi:hypothetical protein
MGLLIKQGFLPLLIGDTPGNFKWNVEKESSG